MAELHYERHALNPRHHLGVAKVNDAAAAQGRGVLDKDDLFVVAQALEDLFGLDETAGDLLPARRPMRGTGAWLPARGGMEPSIIESPPL